jgi:hypothetical protein
LTCQNYYRRTVKKSRVPRAQRLRGCFITRSVGPRPSERRLDKKRGRRRIRRIRRVRATKYRSRAAGRSQDGVLKQSLKRATQGAGKERTLEPLSSSLGGDQSPPGQPGSSPVPNCPPAPSKTISSAFTRHRPGRPSLSQRV